jgi:hypothetical protein
MAIQLVVGLFPSSGIALDAYHRLRTEGVPASRLAYQVLQETAPPPPNVQTELEALTVDPLLLGDVRHTFARFIHNGETAVFMRAADEGDGEFAVTILGLYGPIAIETLPFGNDRSGVTVARPKTAAV